MGKKLDGVFLFLVKTEIEERKRVNMSMIF